MGNSRNSVIAYVPVLHEGYLRFFKKHPGEIFLIGDELVSELAKNTPYYGRDIRALPAEIIAKALAGTNMFDSVSCLTPANVEMLSFGEITMPDEDISRDFAGRWLKGKNVKFESFFLRWDKKITEREFEVKPHWVISEDSRDGDYMAIATHAAEKSGDWWRQVGAALVKNGRLLYAAENRHMPDPQSPYVVGDPKNNYNVGEGPNYYTSIHAEAALVARAAREGESLKDTSMYVTTFPCPNCARLLREAGIKKVYFAKGHSALDAEDILKGAGVELVYVPAP